MCNINCSILIIYIVFYLIEIVMYFFQPLSELRRKLWNKLSHPHDNSKEVIYIIL